MKKLLCILLLLSFRFENASLAKIVQTNKPYSYEIMKQDIVSIDKKYKVVKVKKIGKTHFGRTIYGIKLGKGKQNIVLIGAHHGREWITSMLLMKKLEGYANAYENQTNFGSLSTDILDDVSIWFIPMLNPDGVTIQQNDLNQFPNKHRKRLLAMNDEVRKF